jgi:hypothetical protein
MRCILKHWLGHLGLTKTAAHLRFKPVASEPIDVFAHSKRVICFICGGSISRVSYMLLQDEHRAFRRQLEDKRPVVESNLLSGRQYIANEPPLSDTSDSEGTCPCVCVSLSSADAEISVGTV